MRRNLGRWALILPRGAGRFSAQRPLPILAASARAGVKGTAAMAAGTSHHAACDASALSRPGSRNGITGEAEAALRKDLSFIQDLNL